MTQRHKHCSCEEKGSVPRRRLLDHVSVSDFCDELGMTPTVYFTRHDAAQHIGFCVSGRCSEHPLWDGSETRGIRARSPRSRDSVEGATIWARQFSPGHGTGVSLRPRIGRGQLWAKEERAARQHKRCRQRKDLLSMFVHEYHLLSYGCCPLNGFTDLGRI